MSSASFSDTLSHLFTAMTQAQPALATCSDSRKSYKTMQRAVQYSENYSAEETECVFMAVTALRLQQHSVPSSHSHIIGPNH